MRGRDHRCVDVLCDTKFFTVMEKVIARVLRQADERIRNHRSMTKPPSELARTAPIMIDIREKWDEIENFRHDANARRASERLSSFQGRITIPPCAREIENVSVARPVCRPKAIQGIVVLSLE